MDSAYLGPERRRAPRLAISLAASVRPRERTAFTVGLVDLSTSGCRIELSSDLEPGSWVWFKLPGLEARYSRVAWCRGCFAGIEFQVPLHDAVVDCLIGMDYVPSETELDRLHRIAERCRVLAARPLVTADDGSTVELLALASYCDRPDPPPNTA
jgi:hypothetical protein